MGAATLIRRGPARVAELRRRVELTAHLAARELSVRQRWTLLGWAWPLARQLAQLAVLVFVFSAVLDLGIENYPVFVFSGLVAWSWFSAGLGEAGRVLLDQRHLVRQARFPTEVLPLVAIAVALVDVLLALPLLVAMLALSGSLHPTVLLVPLVGVLQFVLMAGLGWLTSATAVHLRDIPNVVGVTLLVVFYITPVFYDPTRVPQDYRWLLELNPLTLMLDAYRDLLLEGTLPHPGSLAVLAVLAAAVAAAGWRVFRRLQPDFVDEL